MTTPTSNSPPKTPTELVSHLLSNTSNATIIQSLVSPTATYISLCYSNPLLKKIIPYAGIHASEGPGAILSTFATVDKIWANEAFTIDAVFGEDEKPATEVANVAVFGSFVYRSRTLGKAYQSPFSVHCRVKGGQVVFMQFMEDTFGTAGTFERGGMKEYLVFEGEGSFEVGVE